MRTGKMTNRILGIALVAVLIGAMLPLGALTGHSQVRAAPATIYVPDDYSTIQGAVDAASPGDTIIVRDGIYREDVIVGKEGLTLQSESGAAKTTLQTTGSSSRVVWVTADNVTLSGFTVESTADSGRRIVHILYAAHSIIESNHFIGIDLSIRSSRNNVIRQNTFTNCGMSFQTSYGNSVEDNTVNERSVLYLEGQADKIIEDVEVGQVILVHCRNITVKDLTLSNTRVGVQLLYTSDSTVARNLVSDCIGGIDLLNWSSNNVIDANVLHGSGTIMLHSSSDNTIINNMLHDAEIRTFDSHRSTIRSNSFTFTRRALSAPPYGKGVYLGRSNDNSVTGNQMEVAEGEAGGFYEGIVLVRSHRNSIIGNALSDAYWGVQLQSTATDNIVRDNTFVSCGIDVGSCSGNQIQDNTVDGLPILYFEDAEDVIVRNIEVGQLIFINSQRVVVESIRLATPTRGITFRGVTDSKIVDSVISIEAGGKAGGPNLGVLLVESSDNEIRGNTVLNRSHGGIVLHYSDDNVVRGNDLSDSNYGPLRVSNSNGNSIYSNNLECWELDWLASGNATNTWYSPTPIAYMYNDNRYVSYLGNYWSYYTGSDSDGDGIGDTPFVIDVDNSDNYPLMEPVENYIIHQDVDAPIARASDISGQPEVMRPHTEYTVTAKYFDPDGREDLKYCYLQLKHPSKNLTMMWDQADDHWTPWAGEEGENYFTAVAGNSTPITAGGLEGYELAWTFNISDQWPEVENAIDFGVYAWDDSDLKSGWDHDDTKATFLIPILPDLWIADIKPVQVVWNSDVNGDGRTDLVAGKATMVRVYVGMSDHELLPNNTPIEVELAFAGSYYTETRTITELEASNSWIDFFPRPFLYTGLWRIVAVVDPRSMVQESNPANNQCHRDVTVRQTDSLYLYYIPVMCPQLVFGYGPLDMDLYRETSTQSGEFVLATYPLADDSFTNDVSDLTLFTGHPTPYFGILYDATAIWTAGKLATLGRADVSTGIVPDDYFTYHLMPRAKGVTVKGVAAALGEVGYWTAVAHEVGHVFGLWTDEEQYDIVSPGFRAVGFWVDERMDIVNGASFMGRAGAYRSFRHTAEYDYRPIWIADVDYADLFNRFNPGRHTATGMESDILLLTGLISKDGTVELGKLYMVEGGTLERPAPGDYSAQILDSNGNLLKTVSFDTGFEMSVNPLGIIETDYAAFALTIPYPENTAKLQVQHLGETLIEVNPNSNLLRDAVDSIPDHGFVDNPGQRRNALHRQIDVVERMIGSGQVRAAINMLERDIMDRFQKWLVDEYSVESPLQLSKVEVINLTQAIVDRLASQLR